MEKINKEKYLVIKRVGFVCSFLLFTIFLFLVFKLLNKTPGEWGYLHFFMISLTIILVGILLKQILK